MNPKRILTDRIPSWFIWCGISFVIMSLIALSTSLIFMTSILQRFPNILQDQFLTSIGTWLSIDAWLVVIFAAYMVIIMIENGYYYALAKIEERKDWL